MDLPFKTVLVSTDLSPFGNAALPVAFRLARDHGARLLVATVLEFPPAPNPMYAHYYPMPTNEQKAAARAAARAALGALVPAALAAGVTWEPAVLEGDAAQELCRYAKEQAVSLVVISTHGRTGLKKLVLGSVAERVLRGTTGPLLLVR
jgi:nucleotide-binding universal stress UspA family protein